MKTFLITLCIISTLLSSCTTQSSMEGKFIKIKDNERGNDLNVYNINLIKEVNFGNNMCRFDYFGNTMSGKFTKDNNYIYINVGGELGTLAMEIIDNETLEGEGWISGTFKKANSFIAKNKQLVGYYITKSNLNIRTGPGTEYFKIKSLPQGTKVKVVDIIEDEWCEIEHDGYSAYVSKKFISKEKDI